MEYCVIGKHDFELILTTFTENAEYEKVEAVE